MLGLALTVGKYCDRASRTKARAARKLAAAAATSLFEELAFSSNSLNSRSLNGSHHFPRVVESLGWAICQESDPVAPAFGPSL